MITVKERDKKIKKDEKLYKKNYTSISDIIKQLNGRDPKTLHATNYALYRKYNRALNTVKRIEEEGFVTKRFINATQHQCRYINDSNNEVSSKSTIHDITSKTDQCLYITEKQVSYRVLNYPNNNDTIHIEYKSSTANLMELYISNQHQEVIDMNEKLATNPGKDNVSHNEDVHLADYQWFHEKDPQDPFNADVDNNSEHM